MWWRRVLLASLVVSVIGCVPAQAPTQPVAEPGVAVAAPAVPPLTVSAVVPEPNASAVLFNSAVFVQFNRAVVPLTTLEHPVADRPLTFAPPVDGTGHWINTGLYTFAPSVGWAPSTTYHVSAPAAANYSWSFTTLPPAVATTKPTAAAHLVDPSQPIRVTFNQPIDPSTAHVSLSPAKSRNSSTPPEGSGTSAVVAHVATPAVSPLEVSDSSAEVEAELVDGQIVWSDSRTLVFSPAAPLLAGATYAAEAYVDGMHTPYRWQFDTAPEPNVVRTIPRQGGEAPELFRVELFFSAPMDADDVREHLTIQPELDDSPYPRWSDDDTHAIISARFRPETDYTLSVAAGTHDRFGRGMHSAFTLQFRTPANALSREAPAVAPQAWLISPGPIGTLNAYEQPRALLRTTNVSHFDYTVTGLDEAALLRISSGTPADDALEGRAVLSGAVDVAFERNIPTQTTINLAQLPPGFYRLHIAPKESSARIPDHAFVVTRSLLALKETATQVLAWATDLKSGQPLANVSVRILRPGAVEPIARGTTDADGAVQLEVAPQPADHPMQMVAVLDRPGDAAVAMASWSGGVGPWTFALPSNTFLSSAPHFTAYVYTDRPIYQPGQSVHLKGIVRSDDDAHYSLPPQEFGATWMVRDSQGRSVSSGSITRLSEFGTFDTDVQLSAEAATGAYAFTLRVGAQQTIATATFTVAEYQRPVFDVSLAAPTNVIGGESLGAELHAAYYFGQPLTSANVHWQVTSDPFVFLWPRDPAFRFGDNDARVPRPTTVSANAPRTERKGTTSTDGRTSFDVPSGLAALEPSERFTIEATVTDSDGGQVSNRASVVVHRSGVYVGLKPTAYIGQAGQRQTVELVTVDDSGEPQPFVAAHAHVLRRRWISIRERDADGELHWISRPEDTPVSELDVRSGVDAHATVTFTPADGGEYRVVVEAADHTGKLARTAITAWIAGPGFIPWRINDDGRLELQADRSVYQPGDVAHVIVPAPVAAASALVTVERGKLISHAVHHLSGNSAVLDIPIGEQHVPNAYVSVVLSTGGESPSVLVGYVRLQVASSERQLQVAVEPDRRDYAPRETVTYTVTTRDYEGHGVAAEVSLALVDKAVLALMDARSDPVSAFWHERPVGVQTGSSLGVSIDRMNESASSGRKGGGGGESTTVRQSFPDTAFWAPAVRTNADGIAHVEVLLPDTLTTWRMTAVAITPDTRVGTATSEVVTSKPLLIRPLAPRFLVAGDMVTLAAAVHNTTSVPMAASASLVADGVTLSGDAQRSVTIPAGGQARLEWPATASRSVGTGGQAMLHFAVSSGDVRDLIDVRLPLLPWGVATSVATAGEVGPAATSSETVDIPDDVDPGRGELTVAVAPSLAAALRYSLHQVEEYPYECLEQTVSRFLPRLTLQHAISGLGLNDPLGLVADLPGLVTRSLQRMYRYQNPDGGWGWWQGDTTNPYLTAYAVLGLVEARRDGLTVDPDVLARGATYLRQWLNTDPGPYGLETRAYAVYVLGEADMPDASRTSALFDRRAELSSMGKAYLAQALARIDANDARIGGLLADVTTSAVVSATGTHWELSQAKPDVKAWIMGSDVRTTAGVLDALVRLRPDHPLIPSAVRWLMAARRSESWESTQDTAQSLLALTDYLASSGELQGSYAWQLNVNAATVSSGAVDRATVTASPVESVVPLPRLAVGANQVDLLRTVGPGRLYYTLQLRTFDLSDDMPFVSQGFSIGREYLPVTGDDSRPLSEVHLGDLVRVRVTLVTSATLHDLLLEDPLPAGLEPVDTRLKTTSLAVGNALRGLQGRAWQPWTHVDVRSDRVALFANVISSGVYQYSYVARATMAGQYHVLPTSGHEQYFPEVFAHGDGQHITVLP